MLKRYLHHPLEAGTDESGRGCLAGPVTAAAIILPDDYEEEHLNDSKKLSGTLRALLKPRIEARAVSYGIFHVYPDEIDRINILNASFMAMHGALRKLHPNPPFVIVDGDRFKPFGNIPYECIIQGDGKYLSIAAASVLAKTYRDAYMVRIHKEYPVYNWKQNKGYPTLEHREAIRRYGISPYHRKTFRLLPEQLKMDL